MVFSGGLKIITAYDPRVQASVDQVYDDPAVLNYYARNGEKLQSNITVVDNSTGFVVAMGTTFPKTTNRGWNYPVDTVKQPGSSIKPLAVYSPGFELGLINPGSPIDDSQTMTVNGRAWPNNFPAIYKGLTSVREGVVRSANAVSVHVLEKVTPQESYKFMTERFKFTSLNEQYDIAYSPLAVGGLTHGLSTHEMAAAFATFPRNGAFVSARTVSTHALNIIDRKIGDVYETLVDNDPHGGEIILKQSTVYYMDSILRDVVNTSAGTGTGARMRGQTVAGKTGTTDAGTDLWFCGYTHYYTAAIWAGFDIPALIPQSAINRVPCQALFREVMTPLCDGLPDQPLPEPEGLQTYHLCADCGLLANSTCDADPRGSRVSTVKLFPEDAPTEECQCHVSMLVCTGGVVPPGAGGETGENGENGEGETGEMTAVTGFFTPTIYCPSESLTTVSLVDYVRELAPGAATPSDQSYLLSNFQLNPCPVHDENWVPVPSEDPNASEEPTESPDVSEPPVSEPPAPPVSAPPTPPVTEPPVSEPPAPPVTEPPTEPPVVSEPPEVTDSPVVPEPPPDGGGGDAEGQ